MSYYVRRTRIEDQRVSWTGPIRTATQAAKERDAWHSTGMWTASVLASDPEVRRNVREWVKAKAKLLQTR